MRADKTFFDYCKNALLLVYKVQKVVIRAKTKYFKYYVGFNTNG